MQSHILSKTTIKSCNSEQLQDKNIKNWKNRETLQINSNCRRAKLLRNVAGWSLKEA
jgi:hypothetical protein